MKKQGFLVQEMCGLQEVSECINDWRSQGCRFVFKMYGKADENHSIIYSLYTYGDLPGDMAEFWSDMDEEMWNDEPEYKVLKEWWENEYDPKNLRVYVVLKEQAEMLVEALDKAGVKHGETKNEGGFSPQRYNYYVEVPDEGGAHYLEELIHMNCNLELIEKFIIVEDQIGKLMKQHNPDDIITILTGPHKGEKITYREWRERVAPIMRNVCRCMGAMFDGKSPRDVQWEEVS